MAKKQSKKQPKKQSEELNIMGATVRRPTRPLETETAFGPPAQRREPLQLSVEIQNPTDSPLYVWASRRAYDYDATTHTLTLYLTEHTPPLPPGIEMISNHPRTPEQMEVGARSSATMDISVPAVMRRRVPGEGLGMSFVEEPIDQIDQVNFHIQYANEPIRPVAEESPSEHRERLRAHGTVMQAKIKPTEQKEK